jgi:predicted Zn-dependent protease
LADIYRELNQPERALAALHVLADSYPPGDEPQKVLYAEGMALLALGRADDAVESFSIASLRDKPTPEILYRLAEAQLRVGRAQDAIVAAKQALDLDSTHQPSQHLLDRLDMVQQAGAIMPR